MKERKNLYCKMQKNYRKNFSELVNILERQENEIVNFINSFSSMIKQNYKNKNNLFVLGNGGLYSEADHFCAELNCTFKKNNRKPFNAQNLASNPSSITAWSNDYDFNSLYARLIDANCNKGDILYIMSTSGGYGKVELKNNLYQAAKKAKSKKMRVISILGNFTTIIAKKSNIYLNLNSKKTSTIQESILFINHLICESLESKT